MHRARLAAQQQGLARGAIAWHIAGGEAVNVWDAGEKGWCVNLLRRGLNLDPSCSEAALLLAKSLVAIRRLPEAREALPTCWHGVSNRC